GTNNPWNTAPIRATRKDTREPDTSCTTVGLFADCCVKPTRQHFIDNGAFVEFVIADIFEEPVDQRGVPAAGQVLSHNQWPSGHSVCLFLLPHGVDGGPCGVGNFEPTM
ncbi:MAG: hypothetical protein J2P17_10455, partial [Mycobacterium sp.]|nr:hypothetical protein [Mycobacterium sp.]